MSSNIAILTTSYLPVQGGIQYLLYWILKEIDENYVEYKKKYCFDNLYFIIPKYENTTFDQFNKIKILYINEINSKQSLVENIFLIRKIIKEYNISLIHSHNALIDGILCLGTTLFNRCKYIITSHGIDFAYNKKMNYGARSSWIKEQIIKIVARNAVKITTVSNDMTNFIEELVDKKKVIVIENCYDNYKIVYDENEILKELESIKKQYEIEESDTIYLTLSGARKIKGHANMIEAFSKISNKLNNTKIFIAAHGDETNNLIELVKEKKLENQIFFINFITGVTKEAFFRLSNIYINTAFFEPFGLVYLEAIENKMAVFGSIYGGGKDIFKHKINAYLSNPNEIDTIMEGFKYYNYKANITLMINNSQLLLENYTVEKIVNKYINIYMDCIDAK